MELSAFSQIISHKFKIGNSLLGLVQKKKIIMNYPLIFHCAIIKVGCHVH